MSFDTYARNVLKFQRITRTAYREVGFEKLFRTLSHPSMAMKFLHAPMEKAVVLERSF